MIGIHDMGGMHHLGPVDRRGDDVVFAEDWQGRTFGIQLFGAIIGDWTSDEYRHIIERMPPAEYMEHSYYQHWLAALEELFVRRGHVTRAELDERIAAIHAGLDEKANPVPEPDPEVVERHREAMHRLAKVGGGVRRPDGERHFQVGDRVRAGMKAGPGHTRLPRYAWHREGTVVSYSGTYAVPEVASVRGATGDPEPVYAVRFEGTELWGDGAEPGTSLTTELWESYMELVDRPVAGVAEKESK